MSRGGDQKHFPCDGARGDGPVYTFEPGSIITVSVNEVVPHPSYFRIAFDNDGEDAFVEPKSIKPIDPNRACPFDANDKCGESDFCNVKSADGGATVLWDNLEPHMAGRTKMYSWTVKLPNVECENCVIQILQIMEDTVHGAYCPTGSCTDTSLEDIYHRCIDIKLKKGATNGPGVATSEMTNMGMQCVQYGAGMPAAGAGGSSGSAGAAGAMATAGASAAGMSGAGSTATNAGTGAAGMSAPSTPMPSGGTGAAPKAGTSSMAMAMAGAAAPTNTGVMQGANSIAGTSAQPMNSAGVGAQALPSKSGGCSVTSARAGTSQAAAWLLAIAAIALVRRRRRLL